MDRGKSDSVLGFEEVNDENVLSRLRKVAIGIAKFLVSHGPATEKADDDCWDI